MNSPSAALFFNGASKGNLGSSGAGGFISSPDRMTEFNFSWGLSIMTNSQAESYSLLMAIHLPKDFGFKSIHIFGDSEMLIKKLNSGDCFQNFALNNSLQQIRNLLKEFDRVFSFHIMRSLNDLADVLANKGCLLPQGFLSSTVEPVLFTQYLNNSVISSVGGSL